jgi:membrane fusion protein, multidrug efflux system
VGKLWPVALVTVLVAGGLAVLVHARRDAGPVSDVGRTRPAGAGTTPAPPAAPPPPGARPADYLGVVISDQAVDVAANLDGRLADVLVRVGDQVVQGAPLATLDLRTLQSDLAVARATVKAAKANQARARVELADAAGRLERAIKLGAMIPTADLEAARSEEKLAQTRLDSARAGVAEAEARVAKLEVSRTDSSVRAPFTGVVAARYLDPGALVHPQTPIVRLISAETLRVRFAVPEDEARWVVPGRAITARLPALGLELTGVVESLAPEVDPAARMIFAEARLEPPPAPAPRPPAGLVARITPARPPG